MPPVLLDPRTSPDHAAQLLTMIGSGKVTMGYPAALDKWIAMRESDRARLLQLAQWDVTKQGPYRIDPMPEKVSTAFADFLWGEDPTIEPNNEADAENLEQIVSNNDLSDDLHYAEEIRSSEGQVWWRIYRDDDQFPYPVIEWHSRTEVIPFFRGKRLLAVAFVVVVEDSMSEETGPTVIGGAGQRQIWRRLEVFGPGVTYNALFKSATAGELGSQVPLDSHEDTADMPEEWRHGLPMLAGRLVNRRGSGRWNEGRSDYHGVEDFMFDLNEAHAVDKANFKLAGRKRSVMPEQYRKADGTAEDADVYFVPEGVDEMEAAEFHFKVLEYNYNGTESIERKRDLANTILTRVGLARQLVDPNDSEGQPATGVALRTRLIPMVATARGKARAWDEGLPVILMLAQMVDALDIQRYGFGRPWRAAGEQPSIERGSILPEDPQEELDYHVAATAADLESLETAIQDIHKDWEPGQVKKEVAKILDENARAAGFPSEFDGGAPEEVAPEEVPEEELV